MNMPNNARFTTNDWLRVTGPGDSCLIFISLKQLCIGIVVVDDKSPANVQLFGDRNVLIIISVVILPPIHVLHMNMGNE